MIRSKRRSISIEIDEQGRLKIRAPYNTPLSEIDAFITSKQNWIAQKQLLVKERAARFISPTWEEGSRIPFLGQMIALRYHDRSCITLSGFTSLPKPLPHPARFEANDDICLFLPHPRLRSKGLRLMQERDPKLEQEQNLSMIRQWLKESASYILRQRTAYYEALTGLHSSSIKIGSAKRKWGSCSSKRELIYSRQLICLSLYEIDYVIVHELTHIIHMDHSREFYSDLASVLPDHKQREAALDANNRILGMI